MVTMEITDGDYLFSTERQKLDVNYIHSFLSEKSYWAAGIPREVVQTCIDNALCFGVYHHGKQVGFARLVTDYATFGYLADVFIDESYRGRGLSKKLMDFIFSMDTLKRFRRMLLVTRDAHSLYSRHGFTPLATPDLHMELHRKNVYQ